MSQRAGSAARGKSRADTVFLSRENTAVGTVSPERERGVSRTGGRSRQHSDSDDMASVKSSTELTAGGPRSRLSNFVKKVRMGKRIEKAFTRDKNPSSASHHDLDDDPNRTPEPHVCTGHFSLDFAELCRRNSMAAVPAVVIRPRRPPSPSSQPAPEEKTRPGKKGDDKKNQPPPEPTPEPEVDENGDPIEPPPKTYITKEKFEYLKPCVQVEMDNPDKLDTVTKVYIRGWKVDDPMMTVFKQCWPKMDKLHTVNLWRAGLQDDTLEILASILPECANLRNLILDNNPVPGEGYHQLLKDDSPVQNLSLRYNNVTDKGAELLGQVLGTTTQQNQKLVSLNLTGNKITDVGAEHLAKGLRMNRALLSLGLANNHIGDRGAQKLAETLSRFSLTHEEVVERRKLLSENRDRQKSPPPGSRRADSRDRPGSVRSTHNQKTAGKSATKTTKKDQTKGKDDEKDKTKGKKEQEKTKKGTSGTISGRGSGASVVADAGKTNKKGTRGTKKPQPQEHEPAETPELINPLLDTAENMENGVIMLAGNRTLISLNISNNEIGEEGLQALHLAVGYQSSLAQFASQNKGGNTGLMRLCVQRNNVPRDNEHLQKLNALMLTKDPFYKPPAASPDQESQGS